MDANKRISEALLSSGFINFNDHAYIQARLHLLSAYKENRFLNESLNSEQNNALNAN